MKPVIVISLICILAGCSSTKIKYLNSEEFLKQAALTEGMHTALTCTYIGTTRDRVYLEFENYITFFRKKPITTVYWTELNDLPLNISEKIKAGKSPWKPFDDYKKMEENQRLEPIASLQANP